MAKSDPPEETVDPEAVAAADEAVDESIDAVAVETPAEDAHAELRANLVEAHNLAVSELEAAHERAMAQAAPVQKVIDGNEAAAMATITGQKPPRDMSDAPAPATLGAHNDGMPTTADTPLPE